MTIPNKIEKMWCFLIAIAIKKGYFLCSVSSQGDSTHLGTWIWLYSHFSALPLFLQMVLADVQDILMTYHYHCYIQNDQLPSTHHIQDILYLLYWWFCYFQVSILLLSFFCQFHYTSCSMVSSAFLISSWCSSRYLKNEPSPPKTSSSLLTIGYASIQESVFLDSSGE